MPSILSKILMTDWNLPYNCYELGHTWTPFCSEAALEIGLIVFEESLKLYTPLYFANQAFQRKFDRKTFKDSMFSIIRSSTFLGINAFLVICFFCLSRHILGRFYLVFSAYVPSFFGSLLAILTERPSRRRALAFYVANIASETAYRILVSRNHIRPLPHGRFLLFAFSITSLICMYESGMLRDPFVKFVFQLVLGQPQRSTSAILTPMIESPDGIAPENDQLLTKRGRLHRLFEYFRAGFPLSSAFLSARHRLCQHEDGCVKHVLLDALLKPFLIGYSSQLAFGIVPRLLTLKPNLLRNYLLNRHYLFSSKHVSLGLFMASFVTLYKTTRCVLRHITNTDTIYHQILACLLATPTQYVSPNTSATLYLVWKSIEAFFGIAINRGLIPYHQVVIHLIYAMATAELFYAAVLDPKHIKPSYKRFLDRITHNRLTFINRNVLEVFGTNSSAGYESILPVYDLAHTTLHFQESILVWLL